MQKKDEPFPVEIAAEKLLLALAEGVKKMFSFFFTIYLLGFFRLVLSGVFIVSSIHTFSIFLSYICSSAWILKIIFIELRYNLCFYNFRTQQTQNPLDFALLHSHLLTLEI